MTSFEASPIFKTKYNICISGHLLFFPPKMMQLQGSDVKRTEMTEHTELLFVPQGPDNYN